MLEGKRDHAHQALPNDRTGIAEDSVWLDQRKTQEAARVQQQRIRRMFGLDTRKRKQALGIADECYEVLLSMLLWSSQAKVADDTCTKVFDTLMLKLRSHNIAQERTDTGTSVCTDALITHAGKADFDLHPPRDALFATNPQLF